MGCMTFFKFCLLLATIFLVIISCPNFLPDNVNFTEFNVSPVKNFDEGKVPNQLLNNVERLFEDEIKGPEGFAILKDELYTTLHGGFVVKVFDDQIIPVVKFGNKCENWWEEKKCGRPLGIKAVENEYLIVADAYYGIFKYHVKTKKITKLVGKDTIVNGKYVKTFNSVDVAKDGTIYYTHSSTAFDIENCVFITLSDGSGRLIKFNPNSNSLNQSTVLLDNLHLANGVVLSPDENFLLVVESGKSRIHKYYLKGPKKFTSEIFIDGLPGVPDNLRVIDEDRVFVSLILTRSASHPVLFQAISNLPSLRKFLVRFMYLIEIILNKLDTLYPNNFIKQAIHYVGHFESLTWAFPVNITLLEINMKGHVIKSYHGSDGSFPLLSDAIIHNDYMYLGSPVNPYLGRIPLFNFREKIFEEKPELAKNKNEDSSPTTSKLHQKEPVKSSQSKPDKEYTATNIYPNLADL